MKPLHIISLVIIALSIGAIITLSSDYTTYESFAGARANEGKDFHVVGALCKEKPQEYNPQRDANLFTFFMKDENGLEQKVIYFGSKPDGFDKTEKIVVSGEIKGNDFIAKKILMKCPSKYVNENGNLKS
jgi:cytochrome c-type biogenesis protein CcmE